MPTTSYWDGSYNSELSKISVTGSRIKRTDIEGPQPLVVITSDDIDQGGFLSVYEAVASVAQNTVSMARHKIPETRFQHLRYGIHFLNP